MFHIIHVFCAVLLAQAISASASHDFDDIVGEATEFHVGDGLPHHYPRTHRPHQPYLGIHDILNYKPSSENERRCIHKVHNEFLHLEYDVTLREGIYNIDQDLNVIHVECSLDSKELIKLFVVNPEQVYHKLDSNKYLLGDESWGCVAGAYNFTSHEPIYRSIRSFYGRGNVFYVESEIVSFIHFFEKSSFHVDIFPRSNTTRTKQFEPDFFYFYDDDGDDNGDDDGYDDGDDDGYDDGDDDGYGDGDDGDDDGYGDDNMIEYSMSHTFSYNYDSVTGSAKVGKIPMDLSIGTAYCEECFYYFTPGITFKLEIGQGTFNWPYVDYLYMGFYGNSEASAYLRVQNAGEGSSEKYEFTEVETMSSMIIYLPIFGIPLVLVPRFQLLGQVRIVESTMDMTAFGGFTATANAKYGIEIDGTNPATIISEYNWDFVGTPLSLSNSDSAGVFNPRLYLIPRLYLSPYGLIDFYVDIKPYMGVEMRDSASNSVSNPGEGSDLSSFNSASKPSTPSAPTIVSVTGGSIYLLLPQPTSSLPITSYDVRYKCSSCLNYYFTDYLYPSSMGFFYPHDPNTCITYGSLILDETIVISSTNPVVYGDVVTCVQLCAEQDDCYVATWNQQTYRCKLYSSATTPAYGVDTSCSAWLMYTKSSNGSPYYNLRSGDTLGYKAESGASSTQVISITLDDSYTTSPYSYEVSFRARNARGASEWSPYNLATLILTCSISTTDHVTFTISWNTNLASGQTFTLRVYEDDNVGDDYITGWIYTVGSTSSFTAKIGDYYKNPYQEDSNDQNLYLTVQYGSTYPIVSSTTIDYKIISSATFTKQSSTSGTFTFRANPDQIAKAAIKFYNGWESLVYTCTANPLSSFCTSYSCTLFCSNYPAGSTAKLYATDTGNAEVLIVTSSTSISTSSIQNDVGQESISTTSSIDYAMLEGTNLLQDNMYKTPVIRKDSHLNQAREMHQTKVNAFTFRGENIKTPSFADDTHLDYTVRSDDYCNGGDGLSYSFYYGLGLQVGMGEVSIPGLGVVLFEQMESPEFNMIGPYKFGQEFGNGCVQLPPIAASFSFNSPAYGDEFGLGSTHHQLLWEYWSIDDNAEVMVCVYRYTTGTTILCDPWTVSQPYSLYVDPSSFVVGEFYYAHVKLQSNNAIFAKSENFQVIALVDDLSAVSVINLSSAEYNDAPVKLSGSLYQNSNIEITATDGSTCQSHFISFPMNVYCSIMFDIKSNSKSIYSFKLNVGATIPSQEYLEADGLQLAYGVKFPEFYFPTGSSNNYFFKTLAGTKITSGGQFPAGEDNDMYTMNSGGIGIDNKMCLSDLVTYFTDSTTSPSDIQKAAESAESILDMLGMEACVRIEVVDSSNSGLKFKINAEVTAFNPESIDWSKYFGDSDDSTFQQFLLLSGSSSDDIASIVFDEILNLMNLDNGVSLSLNVGKALYQHFESFDTSSVHQTSTRVLASASDIRYVDSDGIFMVGEFVDGVAFYYESASQSTSSDNTATIAGAAVGGVIAILLAVGIWYYYTRVHLPDKKATSTVVPIQVKAKGESKASNDDGIELKKSSEARGSARVIHFDEEGEQ